MERSPFLSMCEILGKETALKKCRELKIEVTQEELDEWEHREKRMNDAFKSFIDALELEKKE